MNILFSALLAQSRYSPPVFPYVLGGRRGSVVGEDAEEDEEEAQGEVEAGNPVALAAVGLQ